MDRSFLDIYEDELRFLREMGVEFAQAHPKIGARLALGRDEVPDPYVERLLEGFAFLTARVRMKMEAQYPEFTQSLLNLLYPNVVAPTPSCTILEFAPDMRESSLVEGFTIPRNSAFLARITKSGQTCEFTTTSDMTLRPLSIDEAELHSQPAFLQKYLPETPDVEAAIRLRFRVVADFPLGMVSLDPLQIYIAGKGSESDHIQQSLLMDSVAVFAYPADPDFHPENPSNVTIRHDGFADNQNLLPHSAKTFSGHRLIQEAFILPEKFRFLSFDGLEQALRGQDTRVFDVVIGLRRADEKLAKAVIKDNFRLHCAPAINLFKRRADRIPVDVGLAEYTITVDRTRPHAFEVYDVLKVEGLIEKQTERLRFAPLFQPMTPTSDEDMRQPQGYFSVRRSARIVSGRKVDSGYLGSDLYINLSGPGRGPAPLDLSQLVVTTLCTNRGLPLQLGSGAKIVPQSLIPVKSVKTLMRPTSPRPSLSQDDSGWDLINALSLNHLSFAGSAEANAQWLLRLLNLFIDNQNDVHRQMVQAYTGLEARVINRRLPSSGPVAYGRGLELNLQVDPDRLRGTGPFILSSVLERFFMRAASLNSFTQTKMTTTGVDRDARWPVRLGVRHLL